MEQYLRSYVGYQQDDWIFWLPVAQFAYNNILHSTLGKSPFLCMFGETARWEDVIRDDKDTEVPAARTRAIDLAAVRGKLEAQVKKAADAQARYYNTKHKPQSYKVGDMVYLSSKNIKSTRPSKKLAYKYYRSYEVKLPIGKQAYRLRLPPSMKIHNGFYVSLLEPCKVRPASMRFEPADSPSRVGMNFEALTKYGRPIWHLGITKQSGQSLLIDLFL